MTKPDLLELVDVPPEVMDVIRRRTRPLWKASAFGRDPIRQAMYASYLQGLIDGSEVALRHTQER
jgi:hypothetical protein